MDPSECGAYASIQKIKTHLSKSTIFYDSLINSAYYFEELDDVWKSQLLIFRFVLLSVIGMRTRSQQRFRTIIKSFRLHSVILCTLRICIPRFWM